MALEPGQVALAVAEGGFDDQAVHVELVDALPEGGVALGIAGKDPPRCARLGPAHGVAHGGDGVDGGQRLDGAALALAHVAGVQLMEREQRGVWRRQACEVGPDDVVEDMLVQGQQGVRQGRVRARGGRHGWRRWCPA